MHQGQGRQRAGQHTTPTLPPGGTRHARLLPQLHRCQCYQTAPTTSVKSCASDSFTRIVCSQGLMGDFCRECNCQGEQSTHMQRTACSRASRVWHAVKYGQLQCQPASLPPCACASARPQRAVGCSYAAAPAASLAAVAASMLVCQSLLQQCPRLRCQHRLHAHSA